MKRGFFQHLLNIYSLIATLKRTHLTFTESKSAIFQSHTFILRLKYFEDYLKKKKLVLA